MLSMGWLARLLTNWVPQTAIRDYSVRFAAMTQVHEKITCTGQVTEKFEVGGERRVRLSLTTTNAEGQVKLTGDAVVALA
jgi:acyl dehydratase